jgi:hypothetical protein
MKKNEYVSFPLDECLNLAPMKIEAILGMERDIEPTDTARGFVKFMASETILVDTDNGIIPVLEVKAFVEEESTGYLLSVPAKTLKYSR